MQFQAYDIALIPVIVALVKVFSALKINPKYLPIISIVIGILIGVGYIAPGDPKQAILSGIVIGLSAIGAYSGVKNTVENRQEP